MRQILLTGGCFLALAAVCFAEDEAQSVRVGQPAPDFTITGIDGKDFKLSDITSSGKNVCLMFSRAHW